MVKESANNRIMAFDKVAYAIVAALFFLESNNLLNMVFSYMGVGQSKTLISTCIFAGLDLTIGIYFLREIKKNFRPVGFFILVALSLLYGSPYLIDGDLYRLAQYICFILPFFLGAYLIVFPKDGEERFFDSFRLLTIPAAVLAIGYILFIFLAKPDEKGVIALESMNYGNVAYAFLPFILLGIKDFIDRADLKKAVIMVPILVAIVYTGLRSAILCMLFSPVLYIVLDLIVSKGEDKKGKVLRGAASILTILIVLKLCTLYIPDGARLGAVTSGGKEFTDQEEINQHLILNVDTGNKEPINQAYAYYIAKMDWDRNTTLNLLERDIREKTGFYITTFNDEDYRWALKYKLNLNRIFLWDTAFSEFEKAPMTGNGVLYYQTKYLGHFPHNLILEFLVDFGAIAFAAFVIVILYLFIKIVIHMRKTGDKTYLGALTFSLSYLPMHVLFSSLYYNAVFAFTVGIIFFTYIKIKERA